MTVKKILVLAGALLCLGFGALAQTQSSNPITFTVVTPPPCSIASISPTQAYVGTATTITLTGAGFANTSTASYDGAAIPLTFVSATSSTIAIPAAKVIAGSHTIFVTCPLAVLTMLSPVLLPDGQVGIPYSVDLGRLAQVQGGVPPYKFSLDPTTPLPVGLSLGSDGIVTGIPGPGAASITRTINFTVTDSSGMALRVKKFRFVFA